MEGLGYVGLRVRAYKVYARSLQGNSPALEGLGFLPCHEPK